MRRIALLRQCSSACRNPQRRIEARHLLGLVHRRLADDPATGQEVCFRALNLRFRDITQHPSARFVILSSSLIRTSCHGPRKEEKQITTL